MKQKYKQNISTASAKKGQIKDKSSPIHKQFQFMYRTCDRLPSCQQYESVIFMKHHKISPHHDKMSKRLKKKKNQTFRRNKQSSKSTQILKPKNDRDSKLLASKSTAPFGNTTGNFDQTHPMNLCSEKGRHREEKLSKRTKKNHEISYKSPKKANGIVKKEKQKIKMQDIKTHQTQISEFIVIEDSFVQIQKLSLDSLQKKLLATQNLASSQENQFLQYFQASNEQDEERLSDRAEPPTIIQLSTVRKYITEKVIKIQRWWRKLKQQKQISKVLAQKTIEETQQEEKHEDNEELIKKFVNLREITALNHMNSQKKVLGQLYENKKISPEMYADKIGRIQFEFQNEMFTITKLKQVLVENTERNKELEQKIKCQTQLTKNIDLLSPQEIEQQLFSQCQNIEEICLSQSVSYNRKKATGCHFASNTSQKMSTDLYKKKSECIKQEFESENSNSNESSQEEVEMKIEQGNMSQFIEYYNDRQKAQSQIEKRHALQIGMIKIEYEDQSAIDTSVVAIHTFLVNFLKFYTYFYKEEFLKMINMPFGFSPSRRLSLLQGHQVSDDEQYQDEIIYGIDQVIGDQILQDFHQHHFQQLASMPNTKDRVSYEKCHQKAIIDAFNEELNCFRPYYFINGPPYPWNNSQKALTFYFVGEQNIEEVFDKTQYKVLKSCSLICGIICQQLISKPVLTEEMNLHDKLIEYRKSVNSLLMEVREQKLGKQEKQGIQKTNYLWWINHQHITGVMIDVANMICEELVLELNQIINF